MPFSSLGVNSVSVLDLGISDEGKVATPPSPSLGKAHMSLAISLWLLVSISVIVLLLPDYGSLLAK